MPRFKVRSAIVALVCLTLFVLLMFLSVGFGDQGSALHLGHSSQSKPLIVINKPITFLNSSFECGMDGILTVKSGGRLGNLMGEYATLWALARRDGLFPILQQRTHTMLAKYFPHASVPSIASLASNCSLKWNSMNLHVYNKMNKKERIELARQGIFIDGYPTSVSLFHRHRSHIVKEFRFKKQLVDKAQQSLMSYGKNRPGIVFIGLHVRRTGLLFYCLLIYLRFVVLSLF